MSLSVEDTPVEVFAAGRECAFDSDRTFFPEEPATARAPDTFWDDFSWSVAITGSRREKALARELQRLGISYFLPYRAERSAINRVMTFNPYFPSIVFFAARPAESHYTVAGHFTEAEQTVKMCKHTSQVLRTCDQQRFRSELRFVAERSSTNRNPCTGELLQGDQVEVNFGKVWVPGIVKKYDATTPKFKVHVKMHLLNRWTDGEIERDRIRLINN